MEDHSTDFGTTLLQNSKKEDDIKSKRKSENKLWEVEDAHSYTRIEPAHHHLAYHSSNRLNRNLAYVRFNITSILIQSARPKSKNYSPPRANSKGFPLTFN